SQESSEPSQQSTVSTPSEQPSQTSVVIPDSGNVKTSDGTSAWAFVFVAIGSVAAAAFVLTSKKRS
ncbi:MAG TPA: hypothetical protein DEO95_10135, partial [Ruminococcaceae bacterium]|nr:hypothetical protein [Oscillospiraceae bacterium]